MNRSRVGLVFALACVVTLPSLSRLAPGLFSQTLLLQVGAGVCMAIAAISLNLLMGYAGQLSLGHSAFLGIGAFATGLVTSRGPQLPMPLGILFAALVGCLFALLLGFPALRLRGLYLAIATSGFAIMMQASFFRWRPLTGGSAGIEAPRELGFATLRNNGDYLAFAILILVAVAFIDRNVVRTKLGRAFQAIRWDESIALSWGVNVQSYKLIAFALSGSIGAVAGALYGHLIRFASASTFDFDDSLSLIVIVIVGGLGNRAGVVAAALMFTVLPRALGFLQGWELILGPLLLIDVVARHPGGLPQMINDVRNRRAEKRARRGEEQEDDVVIPKLPLMTPSDRLPARPNVAHGDPLLEALAVSVRFGGLQALDGVSLTVPKGRIVGLIGPNGAGKTTLFNAISGFVTPEAGSIRFMGTSLDDLPSHSRTRLGLGRTFQLIGLVKDRSVHENLLLAQHTIAGYGPGKALGYLPEVRSIETEMAERAEAAISALGFQRFSNTDVRFLSHGQQRLLELGCALVTSPELLLLDEPSGGMAPGAVESLADRLREIRDDLGRTILLIEHNIPLVLDVCDELYVLNFGQMLAHGTTESISRRPEVIGAYFGEAVGA